MSVREIGKKALSKVLKNKNNVTIFEKYVYNISQKMAEYEDEIDDIYKRNLYQLVGDILNGSKLKPLLNKLKNEELGWNHSCFDNIAFRINEQNEFLTNPFEVEEGVLECRCGSRRVFSYSKQVGI